MKYPFWLILLAANGALHFVDFFYLVFTSPERLVAVQIATGFIQKVSGQ